MTFSRDNIRNLLWIALLIAFVAIGPGNQILEWFCLAAIVLIGIPHGAADHIINKGLSPGTSNVKYIAIYVATAGGFLVWWLLMPVKVGFVFVILSAFHFGQEMLEEYGIKQSTLIEKLLFGSVCIILPLLYFHQDILHSIGTQEASHLQSYLEETKWPSILLNLAGVLLILWIRSKNESWSSHKAFKILFGLSQILIGYYVLGFIVGFTVYFLLHHTTNSFNHQYDWLRSQSDKYSNRRFVRDLVPFSILSILGLGIAILLLAPNNFEGAFFIALVIISAVSVPHALLFNKMYESSGNVKSQKILSSDG